MSWPFIEEPKPKKKKAKKKKRKARKVKRVKVYKDLSEDPVWVAKNERKLAREDATKKRKQAKAKAKARAAYSKEYYRRKLNARKEKDFVENKMIGERGFVTVDHVASMLNVSTRTLARMREDRGLPFYKVERRILFKEREVLAWMESKIEKFEVE